MEFISFFIFAALILVLVVLPCALVLAALKVFSRGGTPLPAEEAKTIQELHHTLERMEKRIESLETILHEKNN